MPPFRFFALLLLSLVGVSGCSSSQSAASATAPAPAATRVAHTPTPPPAPPPTVTFPGVSRPGAVYPVMLGIDVLAAENFAPLAGKRIGLLTHPPGVNRFGVSTIDVLRRAPNVKLVALFGPEHGIYGDAPAGDNVPDMVDKRTGLPAYSLYGKNKRPTPAQLHGLDAFVIDLQDIGVRSYSFNVCMAYAIEACFENGVEVVVLDRPNPLGGLKVDGPMLDTQFKGSGVGAFRIPYVHGLTMGELARFAAGTPGELNVSEAVRKRGKLVVIPMRGWKRSMRWPETGLTFVPTSPRVPDFSACVGYAMVGLGCQPPSGFSHGVGDKYPFRGIFYNSKTVDVQKELDALHLPGLAYRKIFAPNKAGQPGTGVFIEVTDWDDWRPTELNFYLMRLACKLAGKNIYATAPSSQTEMFNKLVGSGAWWNALRRDGARVDVEAFELAWRKQDQLYAQQVKKFWLYD